MECGKVIAVVVTHNRPNQLKLCLNSLRSQSIELQNIIVVDNASDMETVELLHREKDLIVIRMKRNTGGSGGFAAGMEESLILKPDWIWLIEDDVIVKSNTLEVLLSRNKEDNFKEKNIGILCPAVQERRRLALMHRRYFDPFTFHEKPVQIKKYAKSLVEIDTASFVGFLVKSEALHRVGVPDKRFFIYYDDTEFSLRLKNAGYKIWLVPQSIAIHRRSPKSRLRNGPYGLKHYYNLRNRIIVYRKYGDERI